MNILQLTNRGLRRVRVEMQDGKTYFLIPKQSISVLEGKIKSIFPENDVLRVVEGEASPPSEKSSGSSSKKKKQ